MKCEETGELLPDYLQGRLGSDLVAEVERHLAGCLACGEEAALWTRLTLLPEEQPSPALESRFKAMLESYQEGRWEKGHLAAEREKAVVPIWSLGNWRQIPVAGVVWACLFLICGVLIGRLSDRGAKDELQTKLNDIQGQLAATQQTVALSMLQQQSASKRLEGVTWTTRFPQPDPKVLSALFHTVRFDSSVDVRLASLDVLSRYAGQPEVRRELLDLLQTRQSPLVQIAIIDLLVDLHDRSALPQFRKFQQDPRLDPTVKKRVDWGIEQLN